MHIVSHTNKQRSLLITSYASHHHITSHTSHHTTSHHITLHRFTSLHITSHHIASLHIRSHHITSDWHHFTSLHVTSRHSAALHISSHHCTSLHTISPHVTHKKFAFELKNPCKRPDRVCVCVCVCVCGGDPISSQLMTIFLYENALTVSKTLPALLRLLVFFQMFTHRFFLFLTAS
jgi:hypothetical protein